MSDDPVPTVEEARRALREAEAEAASLVPSPASHLGLPDELPITWCRVCQADVKPYGKGMCPRCHKYVKGSFAGRKHPINLLRRDQFLNKLVAEYRPSTLVLRTTCEHLAAIYEQLENAKPGTPDFQRLIADSQKLSTILESARTIQQQQQPSTVAELSDAELLARAEAVVAALKPKPSSPERETPRSDQSEAAPKSIASAPVVLPAEKENAVSPSSVPLQSTPIELSDEDKEKRAAAIRRDLGWDRGVIGPDGRYRYKE